MINRSFQEKREQSTLKTYACSSKDFSREGVKKHELRTEFQRDRDRIIHSKSFRRLEFKTQVFITKHGDHLRTRLTHSLEVAQLSRTIATLLELNTDLVEAIALGHDLGHTPFGHAGERTLKELLEDEGIKTFKHNAQSVKIVDILEKKYPYNGLKLTLPVREGILKHTSLPKEIPYYCKDLFVEKPFSITLEGQVVAIADEIAQLTHDLDDYLRYNILSYDEIYKHEIFQCIKEFYNNNPSNHYEEYMNSIQDKTRKKDSLIRCLVDFLTTKLVENSELNLKNENVKALDLDKEYIMYNEPIKTIVEDFHTTLNNLLLNNFKIKEMDLRGKIIIKSLFNYYKDNPKELPAETFKKYKECTKENNIIVIADYISGMTDRYAIEQYENLISLN
ncbi:dGTP triphosphohydrolase [Clostridium botulinum]|uniref:dGTP triphosphohydrolase n=1 Tax=Clostridium botulinum TaxID=1491 RepID=UPI003DA2FAE9